MHRALVYYTITIKTLSFNKYPHALVRERVQRGNKSRSVLFVLGGVLLVDLDVVGLGVVGGQTGLALPGIVAGLLLLVLWLLDVAVANGGLLVVAVELEELLLGGQVLEALGLLDDLLKLYKEFGHDLSCLVARGRLTYGKHIGSRQLGGKHKQSVRIG